MPLRNSSGIPPWLWGGLTWICLWGGLLAEVPQRVNYNRDIRPILSDKCLACHGPDATSLQAGLRLDLPDLSAQTPARSTQQVIVPGHPERSELIRRIETDDSSERMPPVDSHKELSVTERQLLRQWVAEGAEYQMHWSFLPPNKPPIPLVTSEQPAHNAPLQNAIDHFIVAALQRHHMSPSPEADRETLIRRVSLDLRGLPPTLPEINRFIQDSRPDAYERMVDQMLASPHFGERMGLIWLDLARYGDTNGYHADSDRPVWIWRDWVIAAFNRNMPFDQFTIWQLAGDLLPQATTEQKVASGFNRNVRFNEEGGADPAEFLQVYAADRVITLGRIWLGLTLNCAQCHSHKYDPISHKEFYQLTAFFNSLEEVGAGGVTGFHGKPVPPVIRVRTEQRAREIKAAQRKRDVLLASIERIVSHNIGSDPGFTGDATLHQGVSQLAWESALRQFQPAHLPKPLAAWDFQQSTSDLQGSLHLALQGGAQQTAAGLQLDGAMAHAVSPPIPRSLRAKTLDVTLRLSNLSQQGGAALGIQSLHSNIADLRFDAIVYGERIPGQWIAGSDGFARTRDLAQSPESQESASVQMTITYADDGTITLYRNGQRYGNPYSSSGPQEFSAGEARIVLGARALPPGGNYMFSGTIERARVFDCALTPQEVRTAAGNLKPDVPEEILTILHVDASQRSDLQRRQMSDFYRRHVHTATLAQLVEPQQALLALEQQLRTLQDENTFPLQMVSVEMASPKPAHVLLRGDFQTPGEQVEREVPAILPPFPADAPRNRLGLAQWLMQANQPLVARVQVNRFWQLLLGEGLVPSMGDFGVQGMYPTHPELLDWLALHFIESGWDVKELLKQIIMSHTYRQSSRDTRRYAASDPHNRYLWRAARVRLPAELIRDNALSIAGLLTPKFGGAPVFPHQPSEFYRGKNNGWQWNVSGGEDRYRRGLYTFWRRTTPYPSFVVFDAPDRAECSFERPRTNTPLQALVTLNDPQFVDAARAFAQRILQESANAGLDVQITHAFQLALGRPPQSAETTLLRELWQQQLAWYQLHRSSAQALVGTGSSTSLLEVDVAALAAWTTCANVVLNLDECITRN